MDMEYRVIQAVNFIENNLTNPIQSEDIALEAGISLRHLNRNFHSYTGDTLKNYLRSRRLTQASKELVNTKRNALDIALHYQFQSPEVFCRAFTRLFWLTPRAFRQIGSPYNATQRKRASESEIRLVKNGDIISPAVMDLPARQVVGKHTVQPHYAFRVDNNIKESLRVCNNLRHNAHKIEHLVSDSIWSVSFRKSRFEHFHEMDNFFCFEVKKAGKIPEPYQSLTLPASKYAVFRHDSQDIYVESTISLAFNWLKSSAYYYGDAPTMFHSIPEQPFSGYLYLPISTKSINDRFWWQGYSDILSKQLTAQG